MNDENTNEKQAEENDEDLAFLKKHVNELKKRFDTVQVVCTVERGDNPGTTTFNWGVGNWLARYGSMREWLLTEEEGMRLDARDRRNYEG